MLIALLAVSLLLLWVGNLNTTSTNLLCDLETYHLALYKKFLYLAPMSYTARLTHRTICIPSIALLYHCKHVYSGLSQNSVRTHASEILKRQSDS